MFINTIHTHTHTHTHYRNNKKKEAVTYHHGKQTVSITGYHGIV